MGRALLDRGASGCGRGSYSVSEPRAVGAVGLPVKGALSRIRARLRTLGADGATPPRFARCLSMSEPLGALCLVLRSPSGSHAVKSSLSMEDERVTERVLLPGRRCELGAAPIDAAASCIPRSWCRLLLAWEVPQRGRASLAVTVTCTCIFATSTLSICSRSFLSEAYNRPTKNHRKNCRAGNGYRPGGSQRPVRSAAGRPVPSARRSRPAGPAPPDSCLLYASLARLARCTPAPSRLRAAHPSCSDSRTL